MKINQNVSASIVFFVPFVIGLAILGIIVTAIGAIAKNLPIAIAYLKTKSNQVNTVDILSDWYLAIKGV